MQAAVSGLIPDRVGILNKEFHPETRRDGGEEPQSLVTVPNILELNPKSLCSAYEVKACVLLIAICTSDRDDKFDGPLMLFEKYRLMLVSGFPFTFSP